MGEETTGMLTWLPLGSGILRWAVLPLAASCRGPCGTYKHSQLGWPTPRDTFLGSGAAQFQLSPSARLLAGGGGVVRRGAGSSDPAGTSWTQGPTCFLVLPLSSSCVLILSCCLSFSLSCVLLFSLY